METERSSLGEKIDSLTDMIRYLPGGPMAQLGALHFTQGIVDKEAQTHSDASKEL